MCLDVMTDKLYNITVILSAVNSVIKKYLTNMRPEACNFSLPPAVVPL